MIFPFYLFSHCFLPLIPSRQTESRTVLNGLFCLTSPSAWCPRLWSCWNISMKQSSSPHMLGKPPKDLHSQPSQLTRYFEMASLSPFQCEPLRDEGCSTPTAVTAPRAPLDVAEWVALPLLFWKVTGRGKYTNRGDQDTAEPWDNPLTILGFPCGSDGKESACNAGDMGLIHGSGRSPGEGNGHHSSILAQRILWTEDPGGLQFMESQSWTWLSD